VGQAVSPVRISEQTRNARTVAAARLAAVAALLVVFLVFGRVAGASLCCGGDLVLAAYLPIAAGLWVGVRRSDRVARLSAYALAGGDAPVVGVMQWLALSRDPSSHEIIGTMVAAMVLLVAASSLWMDRRIIALTAASATVVQGAIEIAFLGDGRALALVQTTALLLAAAGLMAYVSWRQASFVRAASDLLLAQRMAEYSARTAQLSVQNLIEQSPDAAVVHRDGRMLTANGAFQVMTGWTRTSGAVVGPLDWVHAEHHAAVASSFREADRTGLPTTAEDVRLAGANGTWIPVEARSVRVLFEGEPAIATVFRDVSERKKMQEHLVLTERMASMGTLAAGVGHEINNPLAAVMGNLEYVEALLEDPGALSEKDGLAAALREPVSDAREAAERIKVIVRDLRLFLRDADEGSHPLDVQDVLESAIRVAWNAIKHKAKVVRDYGAVPMVEGNRARLGQVFLNLLINAVQAMPAGRTSSENEIRVVTKTSPQGGAVVEIHDNGCGMTPEVARRVFDPFFTTKPVGEGTGLGLAIAHRIVEEVGGRIALATEPGRGTTFRLTFPPVVDSSKNPPSTPLSAGVVEGRRRMLVVDDEQSVLNAMARLIRAEHHEVVSCRKAAEALDRIRGGERFDAILCDMMMPEMTGMDLHAELSKFAPDQARRMVFVTGGAFTQAARTFLASVPNPCVHKPVDPVSLNEAVLKVVA